MLLCQYSSTHNDPRFMRVVFPVNIVQGRALVSFEPDFLERGLGSWLRNHTSFVMPSHRYEADISLHEDRISLQGRDKKTNTNWFLEIQKKDITDVYMGFDDVYRQREDRSMGISFQPLRIRFTKNGEDHAMYLLIDVNRWTRRNKNGEWFNQIEAWKQQKQW